MDFVWTLKRRHVLTGNSVRLACLTTQYAHDVVLTSVRRRFNVMDFVWTLKRRRVLTGNHSKQIRDQ